MKPGSSHRFHQYVESCGSLSDAIPSLRTSVLSLPSAGRAGSGRVQWLFTEALGVILALLSPILFCERRARPPPGS